LQRSFLRNIPVAVRGEGAYVWDSDGNQYLDLAGSAAVNFIGHGVPEIAAAMAEQASKLEFVHSSQFTTQLAEEYAEELLAFAGEHFRGGSVFFTSGGSESTETALKLVRQYQVMAGQTQRYQILSRKQSYHGATLGALSVSGNKRRRDLYQPMIREFAHVGIPYGYRCAFACTDGCRNCGQKYAVELENAIEATKGEAAAFIFEPVSGATLGAVVPPPDYVPAVAEVCRRYGLLLIADEVMTGMGRTGRNFAVEHWNVAPDILVAAKGLSSGYAPLGAVIASKKVIDAIASSGSFLHGFTYNAHPVSLAAGRAVLCYLKARNLTEAADENHCGSPAAHFKQALEVCGNESTVGDVRGIGLLRAIEFVLDKPTKNVIHPTLAYSTKVADAAFKRGLLVYPMQGSLDGYGGDHILLAPPAILTSEQITWAVEQLIAAIRDTQDREGGRARA
jgi:adenosylmethionine-8-amino-7-oxononanoate aminotransferase